MQESNQEKIVDTYVVTMVVRIYASPQGDKALSADKAQSDNYSMKF